ncbi:MAG: ribosome assembly factor SBDS [Nanoarchaeota archaeon]|jgi:ribosome maturation protein SDO1|nr:ribosome assembly factor SBDS [Nanoarchaeota archaeon]|tara:strand:+ start:27083 stop:27781 length:699 start_codon:yes stop_codon:yes gene_type:complete
MTNLDEAVIARLKKGEENFEVLVNCESAIEFKNGKLEDIKEVLAAESIYKDAKKGLHASEHEMEKFFDTQDTLKVAEIIVKEGVIQLTKDYRNKLREEKKKRVIELIRLNAVDSKTGLPHPLVRIENAIEEARVNIDEFKSAEDQIQDVISKLSEILPIKFEVKKFQIKVPAQFAGSSFSVIKRYGKIINEDWGNDGSLNVIMEIPPGMTEEFFDQLNKLTHGDIETKEMNE